MVVSTVECISGFISLFSVYSQQSIGRCPWREGVMLLRMGGLAKAPLGEDLPAFGGGVDHKKTVLSRTQEHDANRQGAWQEARSLGGDEKRFFFF